MSKSRDEAIPGSERQHGGRPRDLKQALPHATQSPMLLGMSVQVVSPLTRQRAVRSTLGSYVALTKPRIIELLLVTTLPTMVVARHGLPSIPLMLTTLFGGALAAGGANAINMVVDRDIDRLMNRTKNRPLVTGAMTAQAALVFAITLEVAASTCSRRPLQCPQPCSTSSSTPCGSNAAHRRTSLLGALPERYRSWSVGRP